MVDISGVNLGDYVCGTCGVPIAKTASDEVVHIDSIPEGVEEHDAFPWVTRQEYLFGQTKKAQDSAAASPGERSAAALERIAFALEAIRDRYLGGA